MEQSLWMRGDCLSSVRERERERVQEGWCEKSLSPVLSATFCLILSLRQENLYFRTAAKLIFPEINSISKN